MMLEKVQNQVLCAGASACPIISIDESVFHQRQVVKKAWSTVHTNITPQSLQNREKAQAVVGAMRDDG